MRLRIDELAARTGTSTRNIRAYQTGGLLPGPDMEGRTGWYGEEHVRRLTMINDLQERGFSLAAIKQTLDAWASGGHLGHLVGLQQVLKSPTTMEPVTPITSDELFGRFPEARDDPGLVLRAIDEDLVRPTEDGNFEAPSMLLLEAGTELVRLGIPLAEVLDAVVDVRAAVADVADRFVELVAPHLAARAFADGQPTGAGVEEVTDAVQRLRPIALEVVRPFLARELDRAIDRGLSRVIGSAGASDPSGAGR